MRLEFGLGATGLGNLVSPVFPYVLRQISPVRDVPSFQPLTDINPVNVPLIDRITEGRKVGRVGHTTKEKARHGVGSVETVKQVRIRRHTLRERTWEDINM